MTERQFSEVERALLAVGDAGTRARRAAHAVRSDNAEPYVVEALCAAERELRSYTQMLWMGMKM